MNSFKGQTCTVIHYLLVSECSSSQFGPNCNTSCSEYCRDRKCNQSTGHCLACLEARSGLLCEIINFPESQGMGKCCTNHCFIFNRQIWITEYENTNKIVTSIIRSLIEV